MSNVATVEWIDRLARSFDGQILVPGDEGYDVARHVHNGLVDKHPRLIAQCVSTSDVVRAVTAARDEGLELSVRGGGHNVAGKAVTEGGLMVDLSLMKDVRVDSAQRTITAGGGVLWGELNLAAHEAGLATTGGVISTTGIAGLTLGGGLGWTMGAYGMAVDNLLAAEVVLASGDVVMADADSDPDLFWAIRGGGGNFGVVTSFTFRAYPLTTVLGGLVAYPLAAAVDVLKLYRSVTASAVDEFTVFAALRHAPDGSGTKLCALPICHVSTDEVQAERDVRRIREFGPPLVDRVERMPDPVLNTLLDEGAPRGALNYWKSAFLTELSDEAIELIVEAYGRTPTTMCIFVIEHFHGVASRIDPTETAFPHRTPGFNLTLLTQWVDPSRTEECITWTRELFDSLRPHMADKVYVNYLDADEAARVASAYGPNLERLCTLKRRYDPHNLFHLNQNITP